MVVTLTLLSLVVLAGIEFASAETADTAVLPFETYLARWWGAEGSELTRPTYRIAKIDNGIFRLHYGIVPGRDLSDYTMPYWPIRSFLSIVSGDAELAEQFDVQFTVNGETEEIGFTPRSGVELAALNNVQFLRVRNRSTQFPEDATIPESVDYVETNVCSIEQTFALKRDDPTIQVHCAFANLGKAPFAQMNARVSYQQSFNWARFGAVHNGAYEDIQAPSEGSAPGFYAWSPGVQRGYEFVAGTGCELNYRLDNELNAWHVTLHAASTEDSPTMEYSVRVISEPPSHLDVPVTAFTGPLDLLHFTRVQPTEYRSAPVKSDGRRTISDMLQNLNAPKVRGLNPRGGFAQTPEDLKTLKEWGCNLVILGLGDPNQVARLTKAAHDLGMEVLLAGHGSFKEGEPKFDTLFAELRPRAQLPDAYGQDEDHYYWYAIQPARDFAGQFGKPMGDATHAEVVAYWADCFVDKWRGLRDAVTAHVPDAGIWFYSPFPSVAHVDPVDSYTPFLQTLSKIDERLTVFPFYYGIDYNQAEYMVRRWKDAGAPRVVFLPMRDFLTKPSQFIRVITAARRGQADGTTGFSFSVGDAPDNAWQWKSVMLAAWANFPTPDLAAFCCLEEPAELVEQIAISILNVEATEGEARALVDSLKSARGDKVFAPKTDNRGGNTLKVALEVVPLEGIGGIQIDRDAVPGQSQGFILQEGDTVRLIGTDATGLRRAADWFGRFVELADVERGTE